MEISGATWNQIFTFSHPDTILIFTADWTLDTMNNIMASMAV
jgi:hypothetical protein